jgi:hypothetical protein
VNIPVFDSQVLVKHILDQQWHMECEIIPNYLPRNPDKDTKPMVVVKYSNEHADTFLRYSQGPKQGFFWDYYGDDMLSVELAIIALSRAPVPWNYRKAEYPVTFKFPKVYGMRAKGWAERM